MTKQLIDGLRTAADWIESGKVRYNWGNPEQCNCGILAQAILGINPTEITETNYHSSWHEEIKRCYETGLDINYIIKGLIEVGMKPTDFVNLEYLTFEGIPSSDEYYPSSDEYYPSSDEYYYNPTNVISYMRTWADSLEKELLNQSTKAKTTIKVTVSC
jgi:hypothetical protein